jgi:ribosomal protein S18 acetylase RimI-like enzyme
VLLGVSRLEIVVKKLTPALIDSFLYFFDHVAFTDHPRWASCYCYFYRKDWAEGEWERRSGEQNRRDAVRAIESSEMNGYLAFLDGQPVGWCHANGTEHIVKGRKHLKREPGEKTGVFACFIIAPAHRGKGIATKLLQAACEEFRREGYTSVQAYPRKEGTSVFENYHGPLRMYLKNGFEIVEEADGYFVVQKRFLPV